MTWLVQQLNKMATGINAGKTRRRKVASVLKYVAEAQMAQAVQQRGWKVAQIGDDYVFAPGNYNIRPIV